LIGGVASPLTVDRAWLCGRGVPIVPGVGDVQVRLQPRARRNEVVGERGGAVVIRVTAPPVDGKANAALCAFVARAAGVPPSRVTVVRGQTSRDKVVRVEGVDDAALRAALLLSE
jgi:uncharacterized protein (TIGR00251 family)